jgi:hypothetical protein
MLSFLPSPFARSTPTPAAAPAPVDTNNKITRSKPSLRRIASTNKRGRGGKSRSVRKSNITPIPTVSGEDDTFNSRLDLPAPLLPQKSTFASPVKTGVLVDDEGELEVGTEDELEKQLDDEESVEARRMMEEIEEAEELYAVLGVEKKVQEKDLRRACELDFNSECR